MKWIKTFENFNEDSDEDLFINYLQYITDEHDLFEIKDSRFLRQGHLYITSDNFQEGYFYHSSGPIDRDSSFITSNRSSFSVTIIKRSYENYPGSMSSDKGEYFFKTEYPELYSKLENYRDQMGKLHNRNQFEFRDYMTTYLISGREFKLYKIEIRFELRKLKEEETPDYQTKRMLKQLKLNDVEKGKLREIGYDLDESVKDDNYVDIANIEDAFLDIKDEFDLDKLSYDQFHLWMMKPYDISKSNFSNSFQIFYKVGGKGMESRVQITILIKSKHEVGKSARLSLLDHREVDELIKSEYPTLVEGIKSFIYVVEISENLNSYYHTALRDGKDFTYYHTTISFYPKNDFFTNEKLKVKNITSEDVIKTIKGGGRVFATIIKDFPGNDPKEALTPVSIDDDGLVTVECDGKEYEVELRNIDKIDIPGINEGFTIDQKNADYKIFYNEDYSDEGNQLRDEVLNHIEDILYHFSDEDFKIEVGYGYPHPDELEFKLKPKRFITEADMNHVQMLNDYLKGEGFIPIQSNILRELDIIVYYERKIISYSLPRLKYMISNRLLSNKIVFKFKIPKI